MVSVGSLFNYVEPKVDFGDWKCNHAAKLLKNMESAKIILIILNYGRFFIVFARSSLTLQQICVYINEKEYEKECNYDCLRLWSADDRLWQ
jgi:hypothetical protein